MGKCKIQETPKAKGAPAYMGQFASLMTIMLAFFIILLSLGQNRSSQYKKGVGRVRNMIGLKGGTGILEFARLMRRPPGPAFRNDFEEKEGAMLIGFDEGQRERTSLSDQLTEQIKFKQTGKTQRLVSSIRFESNRLRVTRDTQFALDQAASLLYSFKEHRIVIEVWGDTGNPASDRKLAAQRAAWLTRHLIEKGAIPTDRIRSVGYCQTLDDGQEGRSPQVSFLLKRVKNMEGDTPRPSIKGEEDHG